MFVQRESIMETWGVRGGHVLGALHSPVQETTCRGHSNGTAG